MNRTDSTTDATKTKTGGGPLAAARFWLPLTVLALLAMTATRLFVSTRDTLLDMVPADVVAYIHSQESFGFERIAEMTEFSADLNQDRPREMAAYAVETGEDDLKWTVLLHWSPLMPPTDRTTSMLTTSGAEQLDRTTYMIRPTIKDETDGRADVSIPAGSLADQPDTASSLAAIRSLAKTQIYVRLPETDTSNLLNAIENIRVESVVAGLFDRPDKNLAISLMPTGQTTGISRLFGIRTDLDSEPADTPPKLLRTKIGTNQSSFSVAKTEIDLTDLFLAEIDSERERRGVPDSEDLTKTRAVLGKMFLGPISVLTADTSFHDQSEPKPFFVAFLPNSNPEDLKKAIFNFEQASFPTERQLSLPGEETWTEFITPKSEESQNELPLHYIVESFDDGSIFSNNSELVMDIKKEANTTTNDTCLGIRNTESIEVSQMFPQLKIILNLAVPKNIELKNILIQKIGDNFIHICG
ncbi:MAG: hypothetical protein ABIJ46_04415 [bacterium]